MLIIVGLAVAVTAAAVVVGLLVGGHAGVRGRSTDLLPDGEPSRVHPARPHRRHQHPRRLRQP